MPTNDNAPSRPPLACRPSPPQAGRSPQLGATPTPAGVRFAVWSGAAERVWVSLFDAADRETGRIELARGADGVFSADIPGLGPGQRYGYRADGPYDPASALWFDPDKLLVDPYAAAIDRPCAYDARLAARRGEGGDTASLVPKAIVQAPLPPLALESPRFRPGGLIYEIAVRAFTMRHPEIPKKLRGTIGALAHPAILDHLVRLGVDAVELMPTTAWIDERHLPPLGLRNAWGYNPVTFMALDPRLAPGGLAELRASVAALHEAGIGVILDVVPNHTGESDELGPTLSLRGLDAAAYYRHRDGRLVNDTGCGNTLRCDHSRVRELALDTLRHFVAQAGVDGFRFDLAPVLGRDDDGFSPHAELLTAMREDSLVGSRVLIAEPWDLGANGYRLGGFPLPFLEWNDRFRDDVRRFWRGDRDTLGPLATRLAGSSDVFAGGPAACGVNYLAAHDGMTAADLVRYERKHNEANGEENRDGHNENLSWNHGVEGETDDPAIRASRRDDLKAMLATLFASRGALLITAGDEFGRTQAGNNNAYCQDNEVTWLDWRGRDRDLEIYVGALSALRRATPALREARFASIEADGEEAIAWLSTSGRPMQEDDWRQPEAGRVAMLLGSAGRRLAVLVNRDRRAVAFQLPERPGSRWSVLPLPGDNPAIYANGIVSVPGRTVLFVGEGVP